MLLKALTNWVLLLPHCGQCTMVFSSRAASKLLPTGGAIPYCRSFSFAASVIQSVVHAGDNTCVIRTLLMPCSNNVIRICARIMSVAGQPEYVGVINTSHSPVASCHCTPRSIPISAMVSTGISGSTTVSSMAVICSYVIGCLMFFLFFVCGLWL